jgi:hypothetical protein
MAPPSPLRRLGQPNRRFILLAACFDDEDDTRRKYEAGSMLVGAPPAVRIPGTHWNVSQLRFSSTCSVAQHCGGVA